MVLASTSSTLSRMEKEKNEIFLNVSSLTEIYSYKNKLSPTKRILVLVIRKFEAIFQKLKFFFTLPGVK